MLSRRAAFLALLSTVTFPAKAGLSTNEEAENKIIIAEDGIGFSLAQNTAGLRVCFFAPTDGWLAVGFNNQADLAGTRFLISALENNVLRHAEHIARQPAHEPIERLGGNTEFFSITMSQTGSGSALIFSVPRNIAPPFPLDLSLGATATLMLAYSTDTDFTHHSTWRRHFPLTL